MQHVCASVERFIISPLITGGRVINPVMYRKTMKTKRQGRIQILTADEVQELYQRPEFNQAEREEYFSLDDKLLQCIRPMSKIETRLYFILFIGYGVCQQRCRLHLTLLP